MARGPRRPAEVGERRVLEIRLIPGNDRSESVARGRGRASQGQTRRFPRPSPRGSTVNALVAGARSPVAPPVSCSPTGRSSATRLNSDAIRSARSRSAPSRLARPLPLHDRPGEGPRVPHSGCQHAPLAAGGLRGGGQVEPAGSRVGLAPGWPRAVARPPRSPPAVARPVWSHSPMLPSVSDTSSQTVACHAARKAQGGVEVRALQ